MFINHLKFNSKPLNTSTTTWAYGVFSSQALLLSHAYIAADRLWHWEPEGLAVLDLSEPAPD